MSETAQRVVLLARAGEARDRMQASLRDLAVDVVLAADPAQIDATGVQAANPTALVVLLEPAVEESLEKLQALFDNPGITVIYEEAELTLSRQGWDAARWMRHLIAKLERHDDVLPPRRDTPSARATTNVSESPGELVFAGEYDLTANEPTVPLPPTQDAQALDAEPVLQDEWQMDATATAVADDAIALESVTLDLSTGERTGTNTDADLSFDLSDEFSGLDLESVGETERVPQESTTEVAGLSLDEDLDEFAWRPREESVGSDVPAGLDDLVLRMDEERSTAPVEPPAAEPAPPAAARAPFDLSSSGLELVGFDTPSAAPAPPADMATPEESKRDWSDLGKLDERIAHLQLVDDATPAVSAGIAGAVWVYAGIGGPDAIRHLLAALPSDFQRPVVIQQKLDGARHDKFVQQLQRVSNLPVELAEAGQTPQAAHVYVLPQGMELRAQTGAWRFEENALDRLPDLSEVDAQRSAVIMLSGGDPALAQTAAALAQQGVLLLAQSPDGCFDAAAPKALIGQGAQADAPAGIAARLQRY